MAAHRQKALLPGPPYDSSPCLGPSKWPGRPLPHCHSDANTCAMCAVSDWLVIVGGGDTDIDWAPDDRLGEGAYTGHPTRVANQRARNGVVTGGSRNATIHMKPVRQPPPT